MIGIMLKYVLRFAVRKSQETVNSSDVNWLFSLKGSRDKQMLMKYHFSLLYFSDFLLFVATGMPVCLCVGMCRGVHMPMWL